MNRKQRRDKTVRQKRTGILSMLAEEAITLSPDEQAEFERLLPFLDYERMLKDRNVYFAAKNRERTQGRADASRWLQQERKKIWRNA